MINTRRKFIYSSLAAAMISSFRYAYSAGVNGSGIPGSPEMLKYQALWKAMNASNPKQKSIHQFNENKYGMFIHWGLYSQCGGVWKGKKMEDGGTGPLVAEWIMRRKEIPREEYATLAKTFNPIDFNADEWVAIAKAAGMKYMVITSKHHDGFALFHSKVSKFNVVDATPFGRDIIRELEQACKKAGLAFGVYYSHALDWRDGGDSGMKDYGPEKPKQNLFPNYFDPAPVKFDDYIKHKSLPQVRELVNNYTLSEMWLDTPIYIPPHHSFDFYQTIYDANPNILVNQRIGNGFGDIGIPGDNIIPDKASDTTWEGIATTNNSWGFKSYDTDWKSPKETLYWLIANVSKGGNFLLNVGPDGLGNIPAKSVENLLVVGRWLKIYGEAIYGTRPWRIVHEGPTDIVVKGTSHRSKGGFVFNFTPKDFWFTKKKNKVYAIALAQPIKNKILITSFKGVDIKNVTLLGHKHELLWKATSRGLEIDWGHLTLDTLGYALEVTI